MSARPLPLTDEAIRLLPAVINVWRRDGRCTVRTIAAEDGRGVSIVHHHLWALRRAGLVAWEPGSSGTLRPLVEVVR